MPTLDESKPGEVLTDGRGGYWTALFDLDGTLIDTKRLYLECFRRALTPILGRSPDAADFKRLQPRSEIWFIRGLLGDARFQQGMESFYREYERLHTTHFDGAYPGISNMLDGLRKAGRQLGIVTGKSRRSWEIMQSSHTLGCFDVLVFDDDVPDCKPDPAGIQLALRQLGASPESTIYIGDSVTDLDAAVAAGVRAAGVLWPKRGDDRARFILEAREREADLFESPADLAAVMTVESE